MSSFTCLFQPNDMRKQHIRNRYVGKSHSRAYANGGGDGAVSLATVTPATFR